VRAPFADVLYACDWRWWHEYIGAVRARFGGELWTCSDQARDQFGCYWIRGAHGDGLHTDPDTILHGMNSGHQAVNLAVVFGARRILLLGYDLQRTGGKSHWHGDHPKTLGNARCLAQWIKGFKQQALHARLRGIEIVNCSRATALECFPRGVITECL
jgi:hypothetical protein